MVVLETARGEDRNSIYGPPVCYDPSTEKAYHCLDPGPYFLG